MWLFAPAAESRRAPKAGDTGSAPCPTPPSSRCGTSAIQSPESRIAQTRAEVSSSAAFCTRMPGLPETTTSVTRRGRSRAATPHTTDP